VTQAFACENKLCEDSNGLFIPATAAAAALAVFGLTCSENHGVNISVRNGTCAHNRIKIIKQ